MPPTIASSGAPVGAPLYAALDLGTNNCRLLVASPSGPAGFRVLDSFSRIIRLGEGLSSTGA
ncbi:MAG TPA: Ppx/GppA family phosphatase, partial [Roseomonas sp.]